MNLDADVILEFRYISKPFLIWRIRMEITIKVVPCNMRGIITVSCTALGFPFYCGLDILLTTDPQNSLIIDINAVMPVQLIPYPAISHVWMLFMDGSDLFCNLLIASFVVTDRILQPAVVGTP